MQVLSNPSVLVIRLTPPAPHLRCPAGVEGKTNLRRELAMPHDNPEAAAAAAAAVQSPCGRRRLAMPHGDSQPDGSRYGQGRQENSAFSSHFVKGTERVWTTTLS